MSVCIDFCNHKITQISTEMRKKIQDASQTCILYPASAFINLVESRGSI